MPASIKNVLIGLFVIAAISIIAYMLLFLHPKVGDNAKTLHVRFTDIDKVNVGTRVTFAGKPVGEVISITELPEARTSRTTEKGEIYVYELVLKVDSGVDVFNSDNIILRTSGLLGERNIEINPNPLEAGQQLKKVEDEILYASQTTNVEDTMKEIGALSKKFAIVLDDFHHFMEDIKKEGIFDKISRGVDNIIEITNSLNQPDKWRQTLDNFVGLSEDAKRSWTTFDDSLQSLFDLTQKANQSWVIVDRSLDNIYQISQQARHSWGILDQTLDGFHITARNAVAFSEKANQIIDYTQQGKGSMGELFVGDELYLRLKSIFHKGEIVMNDINSYGILFHLNKRWQRLQARRLRLLDQLWNPNEFARYFNGEMNEISSSLSRVSMVLNESECYPQSLFCNPEFQHQFSQLLKDVGTMEDHLKMYNEQVIDQEQ